MLIAAMAGVAWIGLKPTSEPPKTEAGPPPEPVAVVPPPPRKSPKPPAPRPIAPVQALPAPKPDPEAVARARSSLDRARSARTQAEARASEAAERLKAAQMFAASSWMNHKKFAVKLRDPGPRLVSAKSRGELLKVERDRLRAELGALDASPRPRRKALIDKTRSPARPRARSSISRSTPTGSRSWTWIG